MSNPESSQPTDETPMLIEAENLRKVYPDGKVNALNGVNLHIPVGQYVAIMGPSGSGKSTLLSCLGALDLPSEGRVVFQGESLAEIRDLDAFRSSQIGFVFQSFYLLPTLTAVENVQIPMFEGQLSASERAKKAVELLEAVGMDHRARHLPMQLSVGERQRIAIARALANDPALLLMDEPTGNLDSKTTAEILDLFDRLHADRGMTLISVTHSDDVGKRAERLIRFLDGQVVEDTMLR
ncbi:ABC transporter ATP-binding protein [Thalassoroseus pseudoceratinae]|uniref:ABC transporter ATP-binding protein n=1 Tax=Thalassoroseus pseudoceratinae TaxID=2713176 RepID=UPI0019811F2F|nr:ABC transporter ATP-binding protein [Thalassoroseus pseudoceratinae]